MLLLDLPNEILWCILRFVPPRDSLRLLRTCKSLFQLKGDERFWRELCARQYGIAYLHPNQTWWQLYVSGDLANTCPHIHNRALYNNDQHNKGKCLHCQQKPGAMCLHPDCQFVGCGDASFIPEANPGHVREHYHATGHAFVLKLTSLHLCEVWCFACGKGKPGNESYFHMGPSMDKPMGERYLVRRIISAVMDTLPTDPQSKIRAIEQRRVIERRLLWSQQSHQDSYLIERKWFMAWNAFLFGKCTDRIPGHLPNRTLFVVDDDDSKTLSLRSDIELGTDFELVGGVVRSYIERVYDIDGPVISGYELQYKPEYRKICESILFRRHIMQRGPTGIPTDP
ncbi:hypothetical protein BDB00DRAFT_756131 [Zychaea mexicana]|uniref:uncharacterized protein n=1 Tax=Zychaea mexicana TaxID=64656 RepID=UPI0022FDCED4|nr:uncharacterized protein BDB00DRAFT_756131 [Zychaea mexicana]KAI9497566.1 hypothetical protein BDB00DRAFT_756131 [Zychaea mexicana]